MIPKSETQTPDERLIHAIGYLLRPLVRLFVRRGILLPSIVQLLKRVYVDVVSEDLQKSGENVTDSRINVLTGVHRRDIRSLRASGSPASASPPTPQSATLLARWLGDPAFLDASGQPLRLAKTKSDARPSFTDLAEGVVKDIRARTLMDDLIARELVIETSDGYLRPAMRALVPRPDDPALVDYFSANLHDHIAAASANISNDEAIFFERALAYDAVPVSVIDRIEASAKRQGSALLEELNAATIHATSEAGDGEPRDDEPTARFRVGLYIYRSPKPEDPS